MQVHAELTSLAKEIEGKYELESEYIEGRANIESKYYKHFLEQLSELRPARYGGPDPSQMRDVRVYCSDGHLDVSGVFLAGVSPIFKSCGYLISVMEPGASALVLPDVARADLIAFFE